MMDEDDVREEDDVDGEHTVCLDSIWCSEWTKRVVVVLLDKLQGREDDGGRRINSER